MTNEFNDDAELLEANFFGREPSRPAVRTQEVSSVGPGIPHVGALWSGSPSPVVLFRGSRSAPVQRHPAAQTSVESGLLEDVARGSPHAVDSELDGGHSLEREARLQTLVANMSRQLHTLGYDWNDVPYYRSPPSQCLSTTVLPVDADHKLGARGKCGLGHEPDERECVMDRPPPPTVMAPVDSQKMLLDAGVKRAVDSRSTGKNVMKPQTFEGKEPVNSFLAHFEVCDRSCRGSHRTSGNKGDASSVTEPAVTSGASSLEAVPAGPEVECS